MYTGVTPTVLGVSTLPVTGHISALKYASFLAIAVGITSIVLQLTVAGYRFSVRNK